MRDADVGGKVGSGLSFWLCVGESRLCASGTVVFAWGALGVEFHNVLGEGKKAEQNRRTRKEREFSWRKGKPKTWNT